jgi:menaquinone-dependent protoporphyrinogen oxidase
MKTLITYSTTHGCTGKIANELASQFEGDITVVDLKNNPNPDLKGYERVIIGGSIHAGQIQKRVKTFCNKNAEILKQKELGLFIACMEQGKTAQKQLLDAYPAELIDHAKSTTCFGGEFDFEKMNFLEKMVVKKVAKINHSTSKLDHEAIRKFSKKMDRIFNPFLFLA